MEGKMKVCVLTGKQTLEWVERDIPQPAAGELQIKLEYVGICGSDLHFYKEGQLANWTLDGPLALGHEPGGVVSAIGEGVEGFEIGDKVSIENVMIVEEDATIFARTLKCLQSQEKEMALMQNTAYMMHQCATNFLII